MAWLEIRLVQSFLAVAEYGSLGRAAAALQVSAPTMSESIAALERQVGAVLFHRLPRGVLLTSAGQELLPDARRVMQDVDTARATVAHVSGAVTGRVIVGVSPGLVNGIVASLIGALRDAYPRVSAKLVEVSEEAALEGVLGGSFDIAFTVLPPASAQARTTQTSGLTFHELDVSEVVLVMPPGTAGDLPPRLSFDTLPDLPLILTNVTSSHQTAVLTELETAQVRPRTAVTTDHWNATLPLLMAGVGMAWIREPEAIEAISLGCDVRRLIPPILVQNYVVHRPGVLTPPAQHLLASALDPVFGRFHAGER